jgi:hypothetical protein
MLLLHLMLVWSITNYMNEISDCKLMADERVRSLDQISTISCDYDLDIVLLINVHCDNVIL